MLNLLQLGFLRAQYLGLFYTNYMLKISKKQQRIIVLKFTYMLMIYNYIKHVTKIQTSLTQQIAQKKLKNGLIKTTLNLMIIRLNYCLFLKKHSCLLPIYLMLFVQTLKVKNCKTYHGILLDSRLSLSRQIKSVCSQGYIFLKNYQRISSKISSICSRTQLIGSCILSRLSVCKAL